MVMCTLLIKLNRKQAILMNKCVVLHCVDTANWLLMTSKVLCFILRLRTEKVALGS